MVDLVYSLGAEYRARAVFVMNSKTAGELRKIKDSHGRFLWVEGLADGQPARLMGYPVQIVEAMPDIGPATASPSPSATSPTATPSPSGRICASCATRSPTAPTSPSSRPSGWAAT